MSRTRTRPSTSQQTLRVPLDLRRSLSRHTFIMSVLRSSRSVSLESNQENAGELSTQPEILLDPHSTSQGSTPTSQPTDPAAVANLAPSPSPVHLASPLTSLAGSPFVAPVPSLPPASSSTVLPTSPVLGITIPNTNRVVIPVAVVFAVLLVGGVSMLVRSRKCPTNVHKALSLTEYTYAAVGAPCRTGPGFLR